MNCDPGQRAPRPSQPTLQAPVRPGSQTLRGRSSDTLPDWRAQARCKGEPTETFFAAENDKGVRLRRKERRAKQICQSCPVLECCLSYALDAREAYGIWGAMTPTERGRLLALRPAPA